MTDKQNTAKAAERNQAAPPEEVDIVELAARIKENTRRVLFTEIKPHSFDIADYAYSFDFCNIDEQWRVYLAMKAAWAWGKETEAKGRFVCTLRYRYNPLFPIDKRNLHDFVVSKRPTLRNQPFDIVFDL